MYALKHRRLSILELDKIITIETGKRGGKPCIRHMRITFADVLGWLASGMKNKEILEDFPELADVGIQARLQFATRRERQTVYVHS